MAALATPQKDTPSKLDDYMTTHPRAEPRRPRAAPTRPADAVFIFSVTTQKKTIQLLSELMFAFKKMKHILFV